jgi:hypothetical protein
MGDAEDYTYAEAAFSKAFKYDPNVVEARVLMVMIYLSRGEKKKGAGGNKIVERNNFPTKRRCISSRERCTGSTANTTNL